MAESRESDWFSRWLDFLVSILVILFIIKFIFIKDEDNRKIKENETE